MRPLIAINEQAAFAVGMTGAAIGLVGLVFCSLTANIQLLGFTGHNLCCLKRKHIHRSSLAAEKQFANEEKNMRVGA